MSLAPVAHVALLETLWNPPIAAVAPPIDGIFCATSLLMEMLMFMLASNGLQWALVDLNGFVIFCFCFWVTN